MHQNTFESPFAQSIYEERYKHPQDGDWNGTSRRVVGSVCAALYSAPKAPNIVSPIEQTQDRLYKLHSDRRFIAGGRYLYAAGRDLHQVNNCILLRCPDSREGWAMTSYQSEMALMTGAGIGVWYGDVRESGAPIKRTGGISSGPVPKMQQINETGRHTMQGGNRRSAIWAGLPWSHPDVLEFITIKDWSDEIKALKAKDWTFPAPMDMTNISVTLDEEFFEAYHDRGHAKHATARDVYKTAVAHMLRHGEPGFTVDRGVYRDEVLRNACTEITSADDSDVCNLGSLVLSRFDDVNDFERATRDAVVFLTAGSMYSDVPYDKIKEVRDTNRRLGLGLIGVHEFLMKRGVKYGTHQAFEVLDPFMRIYGRALEYARDAQDKLGVSNSVGATAIAPNGTIGIIAESTPSADPLFSAAELRNVVSAKPKGNEHKQHVVVDPTAARLVREGIKPEFIEDAYTLSLMPERRLAQQHYLQAYTDHAISSTVNIAKPITNEAESSTFGETLLRFLPDLRGITVYPDGARAGQPRNPVDLAWALSNEGTIFEGNEETCVGGVCGV